MSKRKFHIYNAADFIPFVILSHQGLNPIKLAYNRCWLQGELS